MALVSSKPLLERAMEEQFAVGAFNATNMETVQAIIGAAEEEKSPVILQVSQGSLAYTGLEYAAAMVKVAASIARVPVVLHLDHGVDLETNVRALRAGFTSLMYDGSAKPFEENAAITRQICAIGHAANVPVEGELGQVGDARDVLSSIEIAARMTDARQARDFVEHTGVDSLAVAVGSVHKMKIPEARLDLERISEIRRYVSVPLVLHGASGVPDGAVQEAIARGICKVNVATQINQAFTGGVGAAMRSAPEEVDSRRILGQGREAVKEVVRQKIRLFSSSGKA